MNRTSSTARWTYCLMLALAVLLGMQCDASAASSQEAIGPAPLQLFGGFLQDVVGNRTRMIQMSVIFVLLGIGLLFKK